MNPLVIFTFLSNPFQWLLEQLTNFFSGVGPLAAIGAFGLATIVTTIAIRAVLFPIFNWQLRTSRRIQAEQRKVAPQIQELRKKYKKEPQKLSAEMNKVYREHGISPFSGLTGCLPALVQMPVLIGLYNAIRNTTAANGYLSTHHLGRSFLWIGDVSQSAVQNGNWNTLFTHPAYFILPIFAGAFTFAQSRMMMPPPRPDMTDQERSMQAVSKQMSLLFPVMIFIFALLFPQGLAIYWVTGTIFMVLQQYYVVGWGGLKVPEWWPGANRVTALSYPKPEPAPALVQAKAGKNSRSASNGAKPSPVAAADAGGADGTGASQARPTAAAGASARPASQRSAAARARANRRRRRH
ncbi:MAG: membrane protein insertase YidC [Candidatus Dormibacteraeota bacterium]|nr:membrane protein insertase YidC [Candidatus Dormibacteraeota bacterium]